MKLTREILIKAFEGFAIYSNKELQVSGYQVTQDHVDAVELIKKHLDEFRNLVLQELSRWPYIEEYFEEIIEKRLDQNYAYQSSLIASLFDSNHELEERLKRTSHLVENFSTIFDEQNISDDPEAWENTDEVVLDIWVEVLIVDRLIHDESLGFTKMEKIVGKLVSDPVIDFKGEYGGQGYYIEATRIREREFFGQTMPNMIDDLKKKNNYNQLKKGLKKKFKQKNKQFAKYQHNAGMLADVNLLIIKTSQPEYQDGLDEVVKLAANELLLSSHYPNIDKVLIFVDIISFTSIS